MFRLPSLFREEDQSTVWQDDWRLMHIHEAVNQVKVNTSERVWNVSDLTEPEHYLHQHELKMIMLLDAVTLITCSLLLFIGLFMP